MHPPFEHTDWSDCSQRSQKACFADHHASIGVRLRSKAAHLPPLLPSPLNLDSSSRQISLFYFFLQQASLFQSPRELFPEVCVFLCLFVNVPGGLNSLRLISLLKLFAPSINPTPSASLQRAVLLPSAIFVSDRPFTSTLLIHSDRRDCRWSAFSNSSTYLLRTLSCLVVAFFAALHGLFDCFTSPIIFFLSSQSIFDVVTWTASRLLHVTASSTRAV
jgi:hypothetical protein